MVRDSLLLVTILSLALPACSISMGHADWIDFVQFNGIQYIAVGGYMGSYFEGANSRGLVAADLGPEFARVKYKYPSSVTPFTPECCRDGDAAYLDNGTPVYTVKGYNPEFRLAAYRDGHLVLFEADTNPKAQTGADLLDIGGKVDYIGVNSAEDGVTELAAITDPEQVAVLVGLVLGSPVDQTHLTQVSIQYFITFHLRDDTIVTRAYSPDSGELFRGIWLPEAFGTAVEQALSPAAFDCHNVNELPLAECQALVAVHQSGNLAGSGWLANNTPCAWFGVSCTAGHVTTIDLSWTMRSGPLPAELGNLTQLQVLNLPGGPHGSTFGGPIPPEWGNLANLQELYLVNNLLSGPIPATFGNLVKLRLLFLQGNRLSGPIPAELGNLAGLEQLHLADNLLSGPIPAELGNLANLQVLDLQGNPLGGTIPPTLGRLANLRELLLRRGELAGLIPAELGNLASLERLDLSVNALSGPIPLELGRLAKLQSLDLSENLLNRSIPAELTDLASLTSLNLWSNQLSGPIPATLGDMANLASFYAENNQLSGLIPAELGHLAGLQALSLGNNQLSGPVPAELGNLLSLEFLGLKDNRLSGPIPPELSRLASLSTLDLAGNQLDGQIPPELGNMTNLMGLYLAGNQLSGPIPPELGQLAGLFVLNLQGNQLFGPIPAELGRLTNLGELTLANNRLSGALPAEVGHLTNLSWLDLSYNQLVGALPQDLTERTLNRFWFDHTDLCEPANDAFQAWLTTIPELQRTGTLCDQTNKVSYFQRHVSQQDQIRPCPTPDASGR